MRTKTVKVNANNFQSVMAEVLRSKHVANFKRFVLKAAEAGFCDQRLAVSDNMGDPQFEILLHKLRSVHFLLTEEERQESKDWLLSRGIYPGGMGNEKEEIK